MIAPARCRLKAGLDTSASFWWIGRMQDTDGRRTTNRLLFVVVAFLGLAALRIAAPVFIALLLAVLVVYLIDPLVVFLQRRRVPLWPAAIISIAFFAALLSGLGVLIAIDLARFGRNFPRFQEELMQRARAAIEGLEAALGLPMVNPFEELGGLDAGPLVLAGARSAAKILSEGILVFFFAVILLLGKYQVVRILLRSFPRRHSLVPILMKHVDRHLRTFLGIKTLASLAIGILTAAVLLAFRVEFAVTWGFLSVLLNFVPAVGPIGAIAMPVLIAFVQFNSVLLPLLVAAVLAVLHVAVSNFIEPRFMGERLDLSFFVIFVSLLFWGWMWGPPGIILAVPVTASLKIVLERIPATARAARLLGRARRPGHPRR
jgi:AI-2 transport protein TqsA